MLSLFSVVSESGQGTTSSPEEFAGPTRKEEGKSDVRLSSFDTGNRCVVQYQRIACAAAAPCRCMQGQAPPLIRRVCTWWTHQLPVSCKQVHRQNSKNAEACRNPNTCTTLAKVTEFHGALEPKVHIRADKRQRVLVGNQFMRPACASEDDAQPVVRVLTAPRLAAPVHRSPPDRPPPG